MTTPATLLVLPSVLEDMRGRDAYRDLVKNRDGGSAFGWSTFSSTDAGIGIAEFEATRARLAEGGYRPAKHDGKSISGAYDRVERTRSDRLADAMSRFAATIGIARSAIRPDEARPADLVQWSVAVHDDQDRARLDAIDPETRLRLRTEAVSHGRILDAHGLERLHEALTAMCSVHMGDGEVGSVIPATPCSPLRVDGSGSQPGGIVGAIANRDRWGRIDADPSLVRLLPQVLLVDTERAGSPKATGSPWLRPVLLTMPRSRRLDPMQALRVLRRLEEEPIA